MSKTTIKIDANIIADLITSTDVLERGKLFEAIGDRLNKKQQGYTSVLFKEIAKKYDL